MDQSLDELQAHWAFYLYIVYYVYFYLQNRWMGTPMCECVCVCVCGCRWNRLTGDPPITERTRLNVRELTLSPVEQKVGCRLQLQ